MKFLKLLPLLLIGWFFAMPVFAQNTTTHTKKASSGSSLSLEKSQMLCKAWKLDSISEYGVDSKAAGKRANDGITFVADGSFFITLDGVASTGSWTYSGGRITAVVKNPDNTYIFKLTGVSDNCLILDFQYPAPDLSRAKFTYSPKK
jgi:hypothetical protein